MRRMVLSAAFLALVQSCPALAQQQIALGSCRDVYDRCEVKAQKDYAADADFDYFGAMAQCRAKLDACLKPAAPQWQERAVAPFGTKVKPTVIEGPQPVGPGGSERVIRSQLLDPGAKVSINPQPLPPKATTPVRPTLSPGIRTRTTLQ